MYGGITLLKIRYFAQMSLVLSAALFFGCGGGGGGGGTTSTTPTTANLTLSIQTTPTTPLSELEVDITLPDGVKPAQLSATQNTDVLDPTNSVTLIGNSTTNPTPNSYPVSAFTVSTNTVKLVILNLNGGQGDGNYAKIKCSLPSGATPSFPTSATVISAADANYKNIDNPATTVKVAITSSLQ